MEETSDDEVITDEHVESFLVILKRLQLGLVLNNKAEEVNIEEIVQDITENPFDSDSQVKKVNQGNETPVSVEKKYRDLQKDYEKLLKQKQDLENIYDVNIDSLSENIENLQTLYKEKVKEISNLEARLEESDLELTSCKDKLRNIEVELRLSQQISGEAIKITELLKKFGGNPGPGLLGPAPSSIQSSWSWSGPSNMVPRPVSDKYQMNRRT